MLQASSARAALIPRRDVRAAGNGPLARPPGLILTPAGYADTDAPPGFAAACLQPPRDVAEARAAAARATAAPAPASEAGSSAGHRPRHRGGRGGKKQQEGPQVRHALHSHEQTLPQGYCLVATSLRPCGVAASRSPLQCPDCPCAHMWVRVVPSHCCAQRLA